MKAQAPGKLVLSGSYSVLQGAPALVAAVDRYVLADSDKPATLITDEVKEAIASGYTKDAVHFDATALRSQLAGGGDRKIGLGSSAAILVATMAAQSEAGDDELADSLFLAALDAHRRAQGGGSGIDVAAACFGGVQQCQISQDGQLEVAAHELPDDLVVGCWLCPGSASTRELLAAVRALAQTDPGTHGACFSIAGAGAESAAEAEDADAFMGAVEMQSGALADLGKAAGVPIITPEVAKLADYAGRRGAAFAPSGAGGGDVALLFHKEGAPVEGFAEQAEKAGLVRLEIALGARGAHRC